MGRVIIYTYLCDLCKKKFENPDDVLHVKGNIINGDDKIFYTDLDNSDYLCKKCFIEKILKINNYSSNVKCPAVTIEEETQNENPEYIMLRKINNEEEEDSFIQFLGHVSRTNFEKIYSSKSLIDCYYPVEEEAIFDVCDCFTQTIDIIYKAFAGIPQIKKWECLVDKTNNLAYIEKDCLLKEE